MTSFYEDDCTVFLEPGDFGVSASYAHDGGAALSIDVQFFNAYEAITLFGAEVESALPFAICRTLDVSTTKKNDTLVVGAVIYYIIEVQHDGTGITKLILSKDPG